GLVHTDLGDFIEGGGLLEELAHLELAGRPRTLAQDVAFATIGKPLLTLLAEKSVGDLAGSCKSSSASEHYGIRVLAQRVAGHLVQRGRKEVALAELPLFLA